MRRVILRLQNNYAAYRSYWRIRTIYRQTRFFAHKSGFKIKSSIVNISHSANILWELFRSVILSIVLATLAAVAVLALGQYGPALLHFLHAPSWLLLPFEGIVDKNQSTYDGLLIGVITVIGIFLTLYLNGVNTVVG